MKAKTLNIINPDAFVLTSETLSSRVTDENKKELIVKIVSDIYNKSSTELLTRSRLTEFREPRQLIQYLLKYYTNYSFAQIGSITGGFDHATIINSKKVWSNLIETSKEHRETLQIFSAEYLTEVEKLKNEIMLSKRNRCYSSKHKTIRNWDKFKHEYN